MSNRTLASERQKQAFGASKPPTSGPHRLQQMLSLGLTGRRAVRCPRRKPKNAAPSCGDFEPPARQAWRDKMPSIKRLIKRLFPDRAVIIRNYVRRHGRFPNIIRPASFNDKVLHRILFDRRPLLQLVADKARVRDYVSERLGERVLPALYHLTKDPQT